MKLGFGFYRHMLDRRHYDFAVQCGATHAVVHLVDYTHQGGPAERDQQPVDGGSGWGLAGGTPARVWELDALMRLKEDLAAAGLVLAAIENIDPSHWDHVLCDGPRRDEQLEQLAAIVRRLGVAGIPILGYNFSLAGVAGRRPLPGARGGAETLGLAGLDAACTAPLPGDMVWNMRIPGRSPEPAHPGIDAETLWQRLRVFLEALVPVAEAAGVRLAAHPDDPPVARLRGQPRLVNRPELYQRLLDLVPSGANALEFCLGTLQEMPGADVVAACTHYGRQDAIAYAHCRNVRGRAPHYRETFLDEGDLDLRAALRALHRSGFDGVVIPDHAPSMTCAAPWHAGMAHALGWLKAVVDELRRETA